MFSTHSKSRNLSKNYGFARWSVPEVVESDCDGFVLFEPAGELKKAAIRMLAIIIKTTVAASIKSVPLEIAFGVAFIELSLAVAVVSP